MLEFFKGWRRKIGCVTLVMALVFTAGWVRSYFIEDNKGEPFLVGQIRLPSGKRLDPFDGRYRLENTFQLENTESWKEGGSKSEKGGDNPRLAWMGEEFQTDGEMKLVLVLPALGLRSKPVIIKIENHKPSPNQIVFEMEETK